MSLLNNCLEKNCVMGRKALTNNQFIEKARKVHNDNYNYDNTNYINNRTNIAITCKKHGDYLQTPSNHLKGGGCRKCSDESRYTSLEEFIVKANQIHKNYYDYSKSIYKSAKDKITIICPVHGSFEQTVNDHLGNKGCYKCGILKTSCSKNYTTKQFIEKANVIHNNKYVYNKTEYINSVTKITITCHKHGDFKQIPSDHLSGKGCINCANYGFKADKPAILYYLKVTTEDNKVLYKIGITNNSIKQRFKLKDLQKIEILKQEEFQNGQDALNKETKIKQKFKEYRYIGPDILISNGNTELFTKNILNL